MPWDFEIAEIRKGNLSWGYLDNTGVAGTDALVATVSSMPMPIGVIWFRWNTRTTIGIMNIYVCEEVRRQGVATFLHQKLIDIFPQLETIYTMSGNALSKPWLKKLGYIEKRDGWYFKVRRSRKK